MKQTPFIERLKSGGAGLVGTWVKLDSLETLEMLAWAGFDFVVADAEHAPHTFQSIYRTIVAAQGLGMATLVRLPDAGGGAAQRILDSGADGVLIPRVRDPQEAHAAMQPLLFSPQGTRGMGITSRAGRWGMMGSKDYVAGNAGIMRSVQLEDLEALRQAPAILSTEGVNAAFVGLGDLSLSSGLPPSDPQVQKLVDELLVTCRSMGLPCGTAVGDAAGARRSLQRGFSYVMVSNDASLFGNAAAALMREVKA